MLFAFRMDNFLPWHFPLLVLKSDRFLFRMNLLLLTVLPVARSGSGLFSQSGLAGSSPARCLTPLMKESEELYD